MEKRFYVIIELVDKDIYTYFDNMTDARKWYYQTITNYFNAYISLRYEEDGKLCIENSSHSVRWSMKLEIYAKLHMESIISGTHKKEYFDGNTGEPMHEKNLTK